MAKEQFDDERDWEPGGIYYDGTRSWIDDDDCEDIDEDGCAEPRREVYQAPARRKTVTMLHFPQPRRRTKNES